MQKFASARSALAGVAETGLNAPPLCKGFASARSALAGVAERGSETAQRLEGFASVRSTLAGVAETGSETAQRLERCKKNNPSVGLRRQLPLHKGALKIPDNRSFFCLFAKTPSVQIIKILYIVPDY